MQMTEGSDGLPKGQARLIAFVSADIDLAFTLLATARNARGSGQLSHLDALTLVIRQTIGAARCMNGSVKGLAVWNEIHDRANRLEEDLNSFEESGRLSAS